MKLFRKLVTLILITAFSSIVFNTSATSLISFDSQLGNTITLSENNSNNSMYVSSTGALTFEEIRQIRDVCI